MKAFVTCLVGVLALISAFCWVKSAWATVLADSRTAGFGAQLGGGLIAQGPKGERIDLHATLVLQSRWNRYAAYSAALCALAQAILVSLFPS
jgi:hypothetical protein